MDHFWIARVDHYSVVVDSTYRYWAKRNIQAKPEQLRLEAEVKAIHSESEGSAGARTLATIATGRGFNLSRYRAGRLMEKLGQ